MAYIQGASENNWTEGQIFFAKPSFAQFTVEKMPLKRSLCNHEVFSAMFSQVCTSPSETISLRSGKLVKKEHGIQGEFFGQIKTKR